MYIILYTGEEKMNKYRAKNIQQSGTQSDILSTTQDTSISEPQIRS